MIFKRPKAIPDEQIAMSSHINRHYALITSRTNYSWSSRSWPHLWFESKSLAKLEISLNSKCYKQTERSSTEQMFAHLSTIISGNFHKGTFPCPLPSFEDKTTQRRYRNAWYTRWQYVFRLSTNYIYMANIPFFFRHPFPFILFSSLSFNSNSPLIVTLIMRAKEMLSKL